MEELLNKYWTLKVELLSGEVIDLKIDGVLKSDAREYVSTISSRQFIEDNRTGYQFNLIPTTAVKQFLIGVSRDSILQELSFDLEEDKLSRFPNFCGVIEDSGRISVYQEGSLTIGSLLLSTKDIVDFAISGTLEYKLIYRGAAINYGGLGDNLVRLLNSYCKNQRRLTEIDK